VVDRHRRYVTGFRFEHVEHPVHFKEYLSVYHPEFIGKQLDFMYAEEGMRAMRAARWGPQVDDLEPQRAPPVRLNAIDAEENDEVIHPPNPKILDAVALLRQSLDRQNAVLTVLREAGLKALWPSASWDAFRASTGEELRMVAEVQGLMRSQIEQWYRDARHGLTHEARRAATHNLRRMGVVLAGEQRGRGRSVVASRESVKGKYYESLYRLLRAIALLHDWPWTSTGNARIKAVAEACGLKEAALRDYLHRDFRPGGWHPVRAAREWTCSFYGIKPKTLSNLLTFTLPKPSRK
jgi:hypothetical protein